MEKLTGEYYLEGIHGSTSIFVRFNKENHKRNVTTCREKSYICNIERLNDVLETIKYLTYWRICRSGTHLILGHQVRVTATAVLAEGTRLCTWIHTVSLTRDHVHTAVIGQLVRPVISIKGHINGIVIWRRGLGVGTWMFHGIGISKIYLAVTKL